MVDDALGRTRIELAGVGLDLGAIAPGHCLLIAKNLFLVAREKSITLTLALGSACWSNEKCVFGHGFDKAKGKPEFHAWLVDKERGEIVDASTSFWPVLALRLDRRPWQGEKPPRFVWESFTDFDARAHRRDCAPRYREAVTLPWPLDADGKPQHVDIEALIAEYKRQGGGWTRVLGSSKSCDNLIETSAALGV